MKILQISSAQSFGGGERYFVDLANSLAVREHEVHAVVRPKSPLPARLSKLSETNIRAMPLRNALDVKSANDLARFSRQHKIQIIHAHMARDYSLAAYAARLNPAAKLIITRHVLFPLNRLHRRVLSRAARVIAVSEAVARHLRAQDLLPATRISVERNGVDVHRFDEARRTLDREEFRRALGLPENSVLVGTVGQLNPLKGHDVFLRAAAVVAERFPQAKFLIAGGDISPRGETANALSALTAELNIKTSVRLLGEVEEVAPLLAALDVFVSASQTESFGLAIAEAMASRLPVVATNTEGANEIIEDGKTGVLVPVGQPGALAESIITLLGDSEQRRRMSQHAYEYACERLQLKRMVDAIEQIYLESLTGR